MLKEKSMSAGEIAEKFDMTQATVSYHLSILKKADLIRENKVKNFIYYELNASVFQEIVLYIKQFTGGNENEKEEAATKKEQIPDIMIIYFFSLSALPSQFKIISCLMLPESAVITTLEASSFPTV